MIKTKEEYLNCKDQVERQKAELVGLRKNADDLEAVTAMIEQEVLENADLYEELPVGEVL